jgi:hypothetical protein
MHVTTEVCIVEENDMAMQKVCRLTGWIVFSSLFLLFSGASAQEQGTDTSLWDSIKGAMGQAANEALKEQIEELKGTFAGQIGDVRLIERRGRLAIFEISYHDVKDPKGLKLVGELLRGGSVSSVFAPSSTDINSKSGKLRILFEKGGAAVDQGWGIETDSGPVETDQVRLTFIRDTHPDEPFGQYLFNFNKTWTDSDAPDVLEEEEGKEESVALADDEQTAKPPVLNKPGTSIKPVVVTKPVVLNQPRKDEGKPGPAVVQAPVKPAPIKANRLLRLNQYAAKALWTSGAGKLAYPGSIRNRKGYVRILPEARLSTGNKAKDLLNTHPQWKPRGNIVGIYPAMKLGRGMHLKSVIGFLQGATESDGVRFVVSIKANGKTRRVFAKRVTPQKYENVDIDLSPWSGKVVKIMLAVYAGKHSRQDYAVWVKPRLDTAR